MPYKIKINDSVSPFEYSEADKSILHSALRHGIVLPHSCQDGRCGECKIKIALGDVSSKDDYGVLSPADFEDRIVLACCSVPSSDLEIAAEFIPELAGIKNVNLPAKVNSFELLSPSVARLVFRLPPNSSLKYLPGQYVDLSYKGVTRSYSIANAPRADGGFELHIRNFSGGAMSENLFPSVAMNELMRISGPRGTFFIRKSGRPVVLIATGTGYAPIKAMLEGIENDIDDRKVYFYWGNSDPTAFYDLEWLAQFEQVHENFCFSPVLRRPQKGWNGVVGRVFEPILNWGKSFAEFDFYLCGSPAMIESAKEALISRGALVSQIYSDAFFASKNELNRSS